MSVYALNLFNIKSKAEYLAYAKQSASEVSKHHGKVIALGKFIEARLGELNPRNVMILVEWESLAAFEGYLNDPTLGFLHSHRVNGTSDYIWHLYEKLEDLKPIFRS